jgi:hypothetical protein
MGASPRGTSFILPIYSTSRRLEETGWVAQTGRQTRLASVHSYSSYFTAKTWSVPRPRLYVGWSVNLLLGLASTVILRFRSLRVQWPRFVFFARYVRVYRWAFLFDKGRGRSFSVAQRLMHIFAIHWLLNCCWPSPAQRNSYSHRNE